MEQILDEKVVCNNAAQTEAAVKKHEAISAEILARVGETDNDNCIERRNSRSFTIPSLCCELSQRRTLECTCATHWALVVCYKGIA